jgi:hypothetical protein
MSVYDPRKSPILLPGNFPMAVSEKAVRRDRVAERLGLSPGTE